MINIFLNLARTPGTGIWLQYCQVELRLPPLNVLTSYLFLYYIAIDFPGPLSNNQASFRTRIDCIFLDILALFKHCPLVSHRGFYTTTKYCNYFCIVTKINSSKTAIKLTDAMSVVQEISFFSSFCLHLQNYCYQITVFACGLQLFPRYTNGGAWPLYFLRGLPK